MLVGASSGPKLDGVLVTDWNVLCVRHEPNERASNGPGDSMEAVDMLSKSGVPGSRYGLVVLMNVTGVELASKLKRMHRYTNHAWECLSRWHRHQMCSCMHRSP